MMLIMTSKKIGKGSKGALWHESNLNPICHSLPPDDDDDDDDDDDIDDDDDDDDDDDNYDGK